MIYKQSNNNDKEEEFESDDENYNIIENNINNINKEDKNIAGEYIYNNSQLIINDNLESFIKEKSFKNIQDDESKNDIFNFASFINSCKLYTNISELLIDFKKVLKSEMETNDYYFNIIHNYFNNILDLITSKDFFKKEKNIDDLSEIFRKIEKHMKINDNECCYMIKKEIVSVKKKIFEILKKNRNNKKIEECIKIIINNIKNLEKNINNKDKINSMDENIIQDNTTTTIKTSNINNYYNNYNYNKLNDSNKEIILNNEKDIENGNVVIHFNTFKKDSNISNCDNEIQNNNDDNSEVDQFSNLNKARFIKDNSIENNIYNINEINNFGKKKKKKKTKKKDKNNIGNTQGKNEIFYDYENLMCPPIKNDDSD